MSTLSEFYLSSASSVVELDLLEISHPNFTMVHRIVRNYAINNGVQVTLEDSSSQFFWFYPIGLKLTGADTDLDQTMEINFGDVGEVLPQELDAVATANGFRTKPTVIYRSYRSDNLAAPMYGPVSFQVQTIGSAKAGSTLNVTAPKLNLSKTGEVYTLDRFPPLRNA